VKDADNGEMDKEAVPHDGEYILTKDGKKILGKYRRIADFRPAKFGCVSVNTMIKQAEVTEHNILNGKGEGCSYVKTDLITRGIL
jgi:hypothetical protein